MPTPQAGPRPGWERHLSRLVRSRGTQPRFVRWVASRERSLSHDPQAWAVQHSPFASSFNQQDFPGAVSTVVMPKDVRQSSRQPD